ncbi:hypothetical protein SO694_00013137 [Aureococcus anophagefferens]|uniref:MYND-type domain-containing protein n=1 Tax=Aureococcus anophagefferens TaxID=44056 RepID=A0ABR1G0Y3_AURAN
MECFVALAGLSQLKDFSRALGVRAPKSVEASSRDLKRLLTAPESLPLAQLPPGRSTDENNWPGRFYAHGDCEKCGKELFPPVFECCERCGVAVWCSEGCQAADAAEHAAVCSEWNSKRTASVQCRREYRKGGRVVAVGYAAVMISGKGSVKARAKISPVGPGDDLCRAAHTGDVGALARLLDDGAAVDGARRLGRATPLLAAALPRADAVRLLLDRGASRGADPNVPGAEPPLANLAAEIARLREGAQRRRVAPFARAAIEALCGAACELERDDPADLRRRCRDALEAAAPADQAERSIPHRTPLSRILRVAGAAGASAADNPAFALLLDHGADPRLLAPVPPLLTAIVFGDDRAAAMLVDAGADADAVLNLETCGVLVAAKRRVRGQARGAKVLTIREFVAIHFGEGHAIRAAVDRGAAAVDLAALGDAAGSPAEAARAHRPGLRRRRRQGELAPLGPGRAAPPPPLAPRPPREPGDARLARRAALAVRRSRTDLLIVEDAPEGLAPLPGTSARTLWIALHQWRCGLAAVALDESPARRLFIRNRADFDARRRGRRLAACLGPGASVAGPGPSWLGAWSARANLSATDNPYFELRMPQIGNPVQFFLNAILDAPDGGDVVRAWEATRAPPASMRAALEPLPGFAEHQPAVVRMTFVRSLRLRAIDPSAAAGRRRARAARALDRRAAAPRGRPRAPPARGRAPGRGAAPAPPVPTRPRSSTPTPARFIKSLFGGAAATAPPRSRRRRRCCAFCGRMRLPGDPKFKTCSRCKAVVYCDAACQKAHWATHKKHCAKKPAEIAK